MTVSLIDVSTYLPEEPGSGRAITPSSPNPMICGTTHVPGARDSAITSPRTRPPSTWSSAPPPACWSGTAPTSSPTSTCCITHSQLPDMPFVGGGGEVAHRLGIKPSWVIDLHNGGCAAFVLCLKMAESAR